ncbi:MAG TPA: phosphoribosylanthranilate isomerase [Chitinophagaceae bacterium]|nr:phosphoribosylanthranilate isomerase [Chitinophagaceae bacterium]
MRTRIKICCISSIDEAALAIRYGADALGLVGRMPSGPGPIEDELIASIARHIHPPLASFLLTCEQSAAGIIEHAARTHTNTVQIVDELSEGSYHQIRQALPYLKLVQVIHVSGEESIAEAVRHARHVDALLLDSGNPRAAIKTLGGTGKVHNWHISREIVRSAGVPVFLAGGLNAGNVAEAIRIVQPFGVDICSGVRTEGRLDETKLRDFVNAVSTAVVTG